MPTLLSYIGNNTRLLLGLIIGLALILRTVGLASYPAGFNADEASFGYDAYSLLKTGRDQWGESWPLTFRSFGDFKLPLYGYLTIPTVALFGLNEFSTRLPAALIGTLAVLATYLLTRRLFPDKRIAFLAAFLLSISPWHVSLSRGAFEANLTTFFLTFGIWAFLKGLKEKRWMLIACFSFGLNLFSYHSARLFTVMAFVFLLYLFKEEIKQYFKKRSLALYLPFITILIFTTIAFFTIFGGGASRGSDLVITNPTDKWSAVADRRYDAVLLGESIEVSRIASNKVVYTADQFLGNYMSYLSPQFLFINGAGGWSYGMISGRGVLYLVEILFVLFALIQFTKGRLSKGQILLLFWVICCLLPAALSKGSGYAGNRAAIMMPAIQIISAMGGIVLYDLLASKLKSLRKFLAPIFVAVLLLSLLIFLEDYIYHAPINGAQDMQHGRRDALTYIKSVENDYKEIRISRFLTEPHIFVAFYKSWDPTDYQNYTPDWLRYQSQYTFLDQLDGYHLGKYTFGDLHYNSDKEKDSILFVGRFDEFPPEITPLHQIKYLNGKPAIYIVNSNDVK